MGIRNDIFIGQFTDPAARSRTLYALVPMADGTIKQIVKIIPTSSIVTSEVEWLSRARVALQEEANALARTQDIARRLLGESSTKSSTFIDGGMTCSMPVPKKKKY